jgi:8-oxo-dGTP pyrophosphatase MutT (NUDIX family)
MQASSEKAPRYSNPPITKIGVVVRLKATSEKPVRYLMVQPKGNSKNTSKNAPPYVLPRGTRMYIHPETGEKIDARDDRTAHRFALHLEDPLETAARELEEEAGVPRALFFSKTPKEFGAWEYATLRNRYGYPIVWYGITLDESDLSQLIDAVDSACIAWMDIAEYDALVDDGKARAGYAGVIKRADNLF